MVRYEACPKCGGGSYDRRHQAEREARRGIAPPPFPLCHRCNDAGTLPDTLLTQSERESAARAREADDRARDTVDYAWEA